MKRIVTAGFIAVAAMTLAACGKSDNANQAAQADNVEMPAEEAVNGLDESASPVPEPSDAAAMSAPSDAAASATSAAKAAPRADAAKK